MSFCDSRFKKFIRPLGIALAATLGSAAAQAADLPVRADAPVPVFEAWNPWMIRGRALAIVPDSDARLSSGGARIVGAGVDISTSFVPELDISYFFTRNIAAELILGVTRHKVEGRGAIDGVPVGNAWLLPPTLTLQYHFTDLGLGPVKPYVGVGVNYTLYFNEEARGSFTRFKLGNSVGPVLQAGVDIMLDRHWGINIDVKKVFMDPRVSIDRGAIRGHAQIDPWIIGTGITYKF